jgi:ABC-type amino acid transport substrate-binding protein
MPAWGDILVEEELDALWRYVATRGGAEPFPEEGAGADGPGAEEAAAALEAAPELVAEGTLTACLARNGGVMSSRRHGGGVGMDYELAAALAGEMGLALDVTWFEAETEEETTPARDTIALLSHGLCDIAPGFPLYAPLLGRYDGTRSGLPRWDDRPTNLTRNPSVALEPIALSRPYLRMEIGLVHRDGVEIGPVGTVADLDGLRLGVEQGTLPGMLTLRQGTSRIAEMATTLNPGPTFLWEMEKGAFDAALVTVGAYDFHRRQNPLTGIALHDWRHPLGLNLGVATLAGAEALTAEVDAALAALEGRGAFPGMAEAAGLHYAPPREPAMQGEITMRDLLALR